jgi:hypothetical protein
MSQVSMRAILISYTIGNYEVLIRIDPLMSTDSVNSAHCYVTPATYTHATIEKTGLRIPFLSNGSAKSFPRQQTSIQQ